MKVIDPGHIYTVRHFDGEGTSTLVFVKREGEGYPGNVGHHEGTNIQEVLRVLIDRVKYLDNQIPDTHNRSVLSHLRSAMWHLESRAAERHGRVTSALLNIENQPVCAKCGHIGCEGACR